MNGYRTIIIGLLLAIGTPALAYLANIDWTSLIGGKWDKVMGTMETHFAVEVGTHLLCLLLKLPPLLSG